MESFEKNEVNLDTKLQELMEIILGQDSLVPLQEGFEESTGDKVFRFLEESNLLYGEDFAKVLASKLKSELQGKETTKNLGIEDALLGIKNFEEKLSNLK